VRRARIRSLSALLAAIVLSAGCAATRPVALKNVIVSYETQPVAGQPAVSFGPKRTDKMLIFPDHVVLFYEDQSGVFVPLDARMKWFKWSRE